MPRGEDRIVFIGAGLQERAPALDHLAAEVAFLCDAAQLAPRLVAGLVDGKEVRFDALHAAQLDRLFLVALLEVVLEVTLDLRESLFKGFVLRRLRAADQREVARLVAAREDAVEGVVILDGDRVVLVVVAAGAGDGEGEGAARHHVDAVVDDVGLVIQEAAAEGEETEGGEMRGFRVQGPGFSGGRGSDE